VLPDTGSWRTDRASVDVWVLDPSGQEVWRRANIRGGDPFSFAVLGPRVREPERFSWLRLEHIIAEALPQLLPRYPMIEVLPCTLAGSDEYDRMQMFAPLHVCK